MKILILGSGAREYSIALALKNENKNLEFYFAPGNGATSNLGTNLEFSDLENLASFSKENSIDLCIVGSEDFLEKGVVDIVSIGENGKTKLLAKKLGDNYYKPNH